MIRKRTLALIVLTIMQIVIAVMITEWSAALFDALEQHSMVELFRQIEHLVMIFAGSMAVTAMHLKIKRDLQISWRSWLTAKVIAQWMNNGHHYQIAQILTSGHDNPDGRIAEDIRIATDEAVNLCYTLFYSMLLLISFSEILWTLSSVILLDIGGIVIPVYGHLVWIAILYAAAASVLGWWAGRPLTLTTNAMQTVEANFRFGLVKARENALAIARHHGEAKEKTRFLNLFHDITGIYDLQTHAWAHIILFSSGYAVLSMAFPILIAAPRYIVGSITLGALMQSVQAFQQMAAALSWPVNNMTLIAQWHASVDRVLSLVGALNDLDRDIVNSHRQ
ncbi:SbmA/BacA-like family transporter [Methylomonas koyamae]|uniref:SbmA/BacA-like family transporter n=1 Tax=Methylomonas koyamae TaxID=702114 RepID=UPI001E5F718C|nr:SbmA/BacA-like family transporter [Methylomonas koyamae]